MSSSLCMIFEDKELEVAFFNFLNDYQEHIYDYFGRRDLFIKITNASGAGIMLLKIERYVGEDGD